MVEHDRKHRVFAIVECASKLGLQPSNFCDRFIKSNPFAFGNEFVISPLNGKPLGVKADAWEKIEQYWKLYSISEFQLPYPSVIIIREQKYFVDTDISRFLKLPSLLSNNILDDIHIIPRTIQPAEMEELKRGYVFSNINSRFLTYSSVMKHIETYAGNDLTGLKRHIEDPTTNFQIIAQAVNRIQPVEDVVEHNVDVDQNMVVDTDVKPEYNEEDNLIIHKPRSSSDSRVPFWWGREAEKANRNVTCTGLYQYYDKTGQHHINKENRRERFEVTMSTTAKCLKNKDWKDIMINGFQPRPVVPTVVRASPVIPCQPGFIQQPNYYRTLYLGLPPTQWAALNLYQSPSQSTRSSGQLRNPNFTSAIVPSQPPPILAYEGSDLSSVSSEDEVEPDEDIGELTRVVDQKNRFCAEFRLLS